MIAHPAGGAGARGRRFAAALLFLAVGTTAASCAEVRVDFSEDRVRRFEPEDYERVLERWTRRDGLYLLDGLDNALTVTATFKSWEYRQAYVGRYAHDFRLTADERLALEESTRVQLEQAHEFFVAATSTHVDWADLAADTSPWQIRLVNDRGDVLKPLANDNDPPGLVAVRRPTPVDHAYFPYLTVFRRAFVLRFPRTLPDGTPFLRPDVRTIALEFAGALGQAVLRWSATGE